MSSGENVIGRVMRRLLYPSTPGKGVIGEYLIDVIDEKITEANLGREAFFIARALIDVDAGVGEYPLDSLAPNYEKGRFVYTVDDADANHKRRYIDIVPYEQLEQFGRGGQLVSSTPSTSTTGKWSMEAAAVYYDVALGHVLEIGPVPNQPAQYVFVYEVATQRPASPTATAFRLTQFDNYITVLIARELLPAVAWDGLGPQETAQRKGELASTIESACERGDRLWWKWRNSSKNAGITTAIGWARGRMGNGGMW